ncbi:MAG: chemotaxis protein CheW [Gemmatimonadales bacterium]
MTGAAVPGEAAFLIVRVGTERYGLPLADVREVLDLAAPRPVPSQSRALRGVMPLREHFVSLVHLGALVADGAAPAALAETAAIVMVGGVKVALEVDDVEAVVDRSATFVGPAPEPWASGIWRVGTELVTVLDLGVLGERIVTNGSGDG